MIWHRPVKGAADYPSNHCYWGCLSLESTPNVLRADPLLYTARRQSKSPSPDGGGLFATRVRHLATHMVTTIGAVVHEQRNRIHTPRAWREGRVTYQARTVELKESHAHVALNKYRGERRHAASSPRIQASSTQTQDGGTSHAQSARPKAKTQGKAERGIARPARKVRNSVRSCCATQCSTRLSL